MTNFATSEVVPIKYVEIIFPLCIKMIESAFECFLFIEKALGAGEREGENRLT